jgi:purine nucleoside permease
MLAFTIRFVQQSVLLSSDFDFKKTYFVILGIAGINPYQGTLGSVGIAQFAVQVALAYEIDARQMPSNWTEGYWLQGSSGPGQPAGQIYGTEVFEVSTSVKRLIGRRLIDDSLTPT